MIAFLAPGSAIAQPAPPANSGSNTQPDELSADPKPWSVGVSPERQERAQMLYAEANKLVEVTSVAAAAAKYQEALRHWDHPRIRYNLAIVLMEMDRPIEVYSHIEAAVQYGEAPLGEEKYKRALRFRRALRAGLVAVAVRSSQPGVTISLNGQTILEGPGQKEQLTQPGEHQLIAKGGGHGTVIIKYPMWPDRRYDIAVDPSRAIQRRWRPWIPWAVAGAGLGLSAAGGLLYWRAQDNFDSFDAAVRESCMDGCPPGTLSSDIQDLEDRAELQNRTASVLYVVGGSALVAGAVLVYLNRTRRVDSAAFEVKKGPFEFRVAPVVGKAGSGGTLGISANGSF